MRLGADIGLVCAGCGHRILMDRLDVERRVIETVERGPERPAEAMAHIELPAGDGMAAPRPRASAGTVFRNRAFVYLWSAQALSQLASNMVLAALMATVRRTTGSDTAVAVLILTFLVPAVLFSTLGGVLVERSNAKIIMLATNLVRAVGIVAFIFVAPTTVDRERLRSSTSSTSWIAHRHRHLRAGRADVDPAHRRAPQPDGGQLDLRPHHQRHLRHRLRLPRTAGAQRARADRGVRDRVA